MKHTRGIRRLSSRHSRKNVDLSIRTVIVEINFNYIHVILTIMVITKTIHASNAWLLSRRAKPSAPRGRVERVNAICQLRFALTYFFFFLNAPASLMVSWSPILSSSSCFDIYSDILASFLPTVST